MGKHTQGTWQATKNAGEWSVERDAVGSVEYQPICDDDGKIVAFAVDYSNKNFVDLNTDHAHLIAAAPDLLKALNKLRDAYLGTCVEVQADAMRYARATIAKVEGCAS